MTGRHTRSNHQGRSSGKSSGDGPRVGRRSYLKLAGAAVGSVPGVAGATEATSGAETTGTDPATPGPAEFSRTVNAAAVGCDPTGERPCDRAFRRAIGRDTLLRFPAGTYRFARPQVVLGVEKLGIVGGGDVSFLVPPEFNADLLTIAGGSRLVFAGIDVDMTASGATPGLRLCARDRLTVADVTFQGRGTPASTAEPVANALSPVVRSPDGTGVVRNVRADNAGPIGPAHRRPDGRAGIRIGSATRGTIRIENCRLDGFGTGGIYASETNGQVLIDGGVYRDNDVAGIRLGPAGTVRNARVEAGVGDDAATYGRPTLAERRACAIRLEGGGSGAAIRGCDLTIGPESGGEGAVVAARDYGGFTVRDTRIRVYDTDRSAIRGLDPDGGRYSPPTGSLIARFEQCSFTTPEGTPRVRLTGRPTPRGASHPHAEVDEDVEALPSVGHAHETDRTLFDGSTVDFSGRRRPANEAGSHNR